MRLADLAFPNLLQLDLEETTFTRLQLSEANCPKLQTLRVNRRYSHQADYTTGALWLRLALQLPSLTLLGLCGFLTRAEDLASSLGAPSCPRLAKIVMRDVSIRPMGAEDMAVPGWHEHPPLMLDLPSCVSLSLTMVDLPVLRVFAPSLARLHFNECMPSACTLPYFSLLKSIHRSAASAPSNILDMHPPALTHALVRSDSSSSSGSSGSSSSGSGGTSTSSSAGAGRADGGAPATHFDSSAVSRLRVTHCGMDWWEEEEDFEALTQDPRVINVREADMESECWAPRDGEEAGSGCDDHGISNSMAWLGLGGSESDDGYDPYYDDLDYASGSE